jgi:hypothetical protein
LFLTLPTRWLTGHIPTVVLTTSIAAADVAVSYQLQANCFLNKPVDLGVFDALVKSINDFWLMKAKLPASLQRES